MPLEIRELVIRAQVGASNGQSSSAAPANTEESDTGRIKEETLMMLEKLEETRRNRKER